MLRPVEPIETIELFPPLHAELIALLRQLAPEDWFKPTPAAGWSVKDMVAHLLDTDMRRLASQRDHHRVMPPTPITDHASLVAYLNQLNAEWVVAAQRISPRLLTEWLAIIGPQVYELFKPLDPLAETGIGVGWAGETRSANWFDIAREYTEKWHHQQHIREAVGAPLLNERRWLHPALDTFVRGLPHTYRDIPAPDGTQVVVAITGDAGGDWTLVRQAQHWHLYRGAAAEPAALVRIDQDAAWRLFTKGLTSAEARQGATIEGDQQLGSQLLLLLAIMA